MNLTQKLSALCAATLLAAPLAMFADSSTDHAIERDARKNMPSNIADKVSVAVQDGVATVTGTLATDSQRSIAISAVKQVPQVRSVDDEIKVTNGRDDHSSTYANSDSRTNAAPIENNDRSSAADRERDRDRDRMAIDTNTTTTTDEQSEHHSDKWIAMKVKAELAFHKNVSATHTDVNVIDGVVTLSGTAQSQAEIELTTQYAKSVEGVRDVKNQMQLRDRESDTARTTTTESRSTFAGDNGYATGNTVGNKIDDSSITTKVKYQLAKHRSTSAMHTDVHTQNGVVYISGNANNAAEKDLVTKLASGVAGVSSVRNDMNIVNP